MMGNRVEKRLLVVGGTGRDVGKTEFICRLIAKFARSHTVYALKVSAIYPGEELFHGNHGKDEGCGQLFEERNAMTRKDTSRMLRAGAKKVFYLRSEDSVVLEGFYQFLEIIPKSGVVICESNSLARFIQPAISVVVKSATKSIKPRAVPLLEMADLVIVSDGSSGFPDLERISCSDQDGWLLQQRPG